PNVVGVIVITFVLTRALPGDPAAFFAGQAASAEAVEQIRSKLGLDKPLPQQFVLYLRDLARGDLGVSLSSGQPVADELLTRLPASLELTLAGLAFAEAPGPARSDARPFRAGAAGAHDARRDARRAVGRLHPHRARRGPRAAHGAAALCAAQRAAAHRHDARHGVLVPPGLQRAGREGV